MLANNECGTLQARFTYRPCQQSDGDRDCLALPNPYQLSQTHSRPAFLCPLPTQSLKPDMIHK